MARKYYYTNFDSIGSITQTDGTLASGTAGEKNLVDIGGIPWELFNIGTNTVFGPVIASTGVDAVMTDTNGNGCVFTPYANTINSPLTFTIGTHAFYAKLKVKVTDWSGVRLMVGFHGGASGTMQAHQTVGAFGDYTDLALIGNYAGGAVDVYTQQCINDTAPTDTDTTINLTDADVATFQVNVSAAGIVTYSMLIGSTAQTLTIPAVQTFDSTDNVNPMILMVNHTETATSTLFQEFQCGLSA